MNLRQTISRFFIFVFSLSLLFLVFSIFSPRTAYFLNFFVLPYPRQFISSISSVFDFSLFEMLVIASPVLIIISLAYIFRAESRKEVKRRFLLLISFLSILPSSYIIMTAIPYLSPSPIPIDNQTVNSDDITWAAEMLLVGVNDTAGFADGDYGYEYLTSHISSGYKKIFDGYELPTPKLARVKGVRLSNFMSYAGILAAYTPPTAEINVNLEIPPYMLAFTVAHEYAHSLGIGGEADANLFAFICCEASDDKGISYSARLCMLEYILSDLYKTNKEMYTKVYNSFDEKAKSDIESHREYIKKYEKSRIFDFSEWLNDFHNEAWDKAGVGSYSQTAARLVNYLKNNQNSPI